MQLHVTLAKFGRSRLQRGVIRHTPSFHLGKLDGIHPKYMTALQRADGYEYS